VEELLKAYFKYRYLDFLFSQLPLKHFVLIIKLYIQRINFDGHSAYLFPRVNVYALSIPNTSKLWNYATRNFKATAVQTVTFDGRKNPIKQKNGFSRKKIRN
jgi:hypothetical protein